MATKKLKKVHKAHISRKRAFVEVAGWYGMSAILGAYFLVSFNVIASDGLFFQLLNLTGALGILAISILKKVRQSIVLNIVWISVAVLAIINIFV